MCVSRRGMSSLFTSLPCLQGACGRQKTTLLKCRPRRCPHGSLPVSPSSMSYTSLFSLPLPFSVPTGSDPFTDCWTLGEKHKSWSVYPCCGTLLAIVTSNLKSLMTIQLEFLPLLKIMACSIYSLSMR